VISEEIGLKLENVTMDDLGTAKKVVATKDSTMIVDGAGSADAIERRVKEIENALDASKSDYDKEKLAERRAKLAGGVAVIKVGAATEVEMKEKKHRIEDAVLATKAASQEGIVAGGGAALLHASVRLVELRLDNTEQQVGVDIMRRALQAPIRQIVENSGYEGSVIVNAVLATGNVDFGADAMTGEIINLVKAGIIDPKKVTRSALQNAASIAATFLTTEAAISEIPKKDAPAAAPAMPGGMGGMGGMY
jgi:chaperonin GroEL